MTDKKLPPLSLIRWGVRGVLMLGVAASVVANVLHANPNLISQSIAAWPPLALLLTVELISRVPVHRSGLAIARIIATTLIAGIAAWVSYWHMAGVALRYGESPSAAHMIPLSVDGLIVVASICLVELSGRIRATQHGEELNQAAIAAPVADEPTLTEASPAIAAPEQPPAAPDLGSPVTDEPAGQPVRHDPRTKQEIDDAVRAIWEARPDLSQRRIAAIAGTSPTNAGRIIREAKAARMEQPAPADGAPAEAADREPELVEAAR